MGFGMRLFSSLITAVLITIIGGTMCFVRPKKINGVSGYRTAMSEKNQDTWNEAQKYSAVAMSIIGAVSIVFSIAVCFIVPNDNAALIAITFTVIALIAIIPVVEVHLHKLFYNDGRRKIPGEPDSGVMIRLDVQGQKPGEDRCEIKNWAPFKVVNIISATFAAASIVTVIIAWRYLPRVIPVHFNFFGRADASGGKGTLIFVAAAGVALYFLVTAAGRLPFIGTAYKKTQSRGTIVVLSVLRLVCTITYFYLVLSMILIAFGYSRSLGLWFLPLCAASALLPLFFMRKNFGS